MELSYSFQKPGSISLLILYFRFFCIWMFGSFTKAMETGKIKFDNSLLLCLFSVVRSYLFVTIRYHKVF